MSVPDATRPCSPPNEQRSFPTTPPFHLHRCTMRIGKGIHPDGVPGWCQGFSLDGGSGVRAVKVIQPGNRPGLIYNIGKALSSSTKQPRAGSSAQLFTVLSSHAGISVRKGKGRYRDTHIVTFAPRYLLDNRSTHKLAFAQKEFARGKVRIVIPVRPGLSAIVPESAVGCKHVCVRAQPTQRATSPPCRAPAWSSTGPATTTTSCCVSGSWTRPTAPGLEASKSTSPSLFTST